MGQNFCGSSQIFSPNGELIKKASKDEEEILIEEIDLKEVEKSRTKIPYFSDIDLTF